MGFFGKIFNKNQQPERYEGSDEDVMDRRIAAKERALNEQLQREQQQSEQAQRMAEKQARLKELKQKQFENSKIGRVVHTIKQAGINSENLRHHKQSMKQAPPPSMFTSGASFGSGLAVDRPKGGRSNSAYLVDQDMNINNTAMFGGGLFGTPNKNPQPKMFSLITKPTRLGGTKVNKRQHSPMNFRI